MNVIFHLQTVRFNTLPWDKRPALEESFLCPIATSKATSLEVKYGVHDHPPNLTKEKVRH